MFIYIGLGLGLFTALILTLAPPHRRSVGLATILFSTILFLVFHNGDYRFGGATAIEQMALTALMALVVSIAAVSILFIRHLRIAVDEFSYVANVAILVFILWSVTDDKWLLGVIPLGVATVVPLFIKRTYSRTARRLYFLSYSIVSMLIFMALFWSEMYAEASTFTNDWFGLMQAIVVGGVLYTYLVYVVCVIFSVLPKSWLESTDMYTRFTFSGRYPRAVLLGGMVVCVIGLSVASHYLSLLYAVVLMSALVALSNYLLQQYYDQGFSSPQGVLNDGHTK